MEDEGVFTTCLHPEHFPNVHVDAVFDGHGGNMASTYLRNNFLKTLAKMNNPFDSIELTNVFEKMDVKFHLKHPQDLSGSTICGYIFCPIRSILLSFNVGDSRMVLFDETNGKIIFETVDHKPNLPNEHKRILAAGGFVENKRVSGQLALSRAFGDWQFKNKTNLKLHEQMVIVRPDCKLFTTINPNTSMLVCCDGIVDHLTNKEVVDYIVKSLKQQQQQSKRKLATTNILANIQELSLKSGSSDNMTIHLSQTGVFDPIAFTLSVLDLNTSDSINKDEDRVQNDDGKWTNARKQYLDRIEKIANRHDLDTSQLMKHANLSSTHQKGPHKKIIQKEKKDDENWDEFPTAKAWMPSSMNKTQNGCC